MTIESILKKYKVDDSNGLTSITPEEAESLAKQDRDLYLNGLNNLSDSVAEALAYHEGGRLELRGLKTLSDKAAAWLAKHKGGRLDLSGLETISDTVAEALAKHEGELTLSGQLSDKAIAWLFKHNGEIGLNGLDLKAYEAIPDAEPVGTKRIIEGEECVSQGGGYYGYTVDGPSIWKILPKKESEEEEEEKETDEDADLLLKLNILIKSGLLHNLYNEDLANKMSQNGDIYWDLDPDNFKDWDREHGKRYRDHLYGFVISKSYSDNFFSQYFNSMFGTGDEDLFDTGGHKPTLGIYNSYARQLLAFGLGRKDGLFSMLFRLDGTCTMDPSYEDLSEFYALDYAGLARGIVGSLDEAGSYNYSANCQFMESNDAMAEIRILIPDLPELPWQSQAAEAKAEGFESRNPLPPDEDPEMLLKLNTLVESGLLLNLYSENVSEDSDMSCWEDLDPDNFVFWDREHGIGYRDHLYGFVISEKSISDKIFSEYLSSVFGRGSADLFQTGDHRPTLGIYNSQARQLLTFGGHDPIFYKLFRSDGTSTMDPSDEDLREFYSLDYAGLAQGIMERLVRADQLHSEANCSFREVDDALAHIRILIPDLPGIYKLSPGDY